MSELTFKLTTESMVNNFGVTLYRIEALVDIKARGVKKGDKGGWVESERLSNGDARVSGNAWVYGDAWVYGNAQVSGNAQVYGNAWVYGDAQVSGDAWVYGDAQVYGNAQVSGDAWVSGDAQVYGNAQVYGDVWVYGNARLIAKARFTLGYFVGGDDSDKPTFAEITDQTGSDFWRHQYVIGEYKIEQIVDEPEEKAKEVEPETITLNGKTYRLVEE
ncbi:polymer-forming cytoskeletal protein [Candidatus Saccharibacteria bacterium]|nr:polymer-forming cytoskeletal protein [Candidatus Saccharibacteria bacterium]